MFRKIMTPVDLAHLDRLRKALATSADLATHYRIPVCYVGVTTAAPGPIAHTPQEFTAKLERFAADQAAAHGIETAAKTCISHDPSADLEETLMKAIEEIGADLVVTGSHVPGLADRIFASHSGYLAAHTNVSVFIVR